MYGAILSYGHVGLAQKKGRHTLTDWFHLYIVVRSFDFRECWARSHKNLHFYNTIPNILNHDTMSLKWMILMKKRKNPPILKKKHAKKYFDENC